MTVALCVVWSTFLLAKSFEVRVISGVPMVCIDGQSVRARLFFGGFGIQKVCLEKNAWKQVDFVFQPQSDALGCGTVHFRFGREPGRIVIDNIEIWNETDGQPIAGPYSFNSTDCSASAASVSPAEAERATSWKQFTSNWRIWPPKNNVGTVQTLPGTGQDGSTALVIDLTAPTNGAWPDFHVYHNANLKLEFNKTYRFRCQLYADTPRTTSIAFYKPGDPYIFLGGPGEPLQEQIKLAAAVGVNFVTFSIPAAWSDTNASESEFAVMDRICRYVLQSNPNALLIPRINMNAPEKFLQENPGERIVRKTKDGIVNQGESLNYASCSSKKYRQLASAALERTVRHLQETFGDSYAGCHPCGQNTGEWFTPRSWNHDRPGYSAAERAGFLEFIQNKYPTDALLQAAWGDASVTRATADVPSFEQWSESEKRAILNVAADRRIQQIIDFNLFEQQSMADLVLDLAAAARKGSGAEKRLVLFFYGYTFEFAALGDGPAKAAHYQLERVLKSPDIDIICSPMSYFDRQPGGYGHAMPAAETITRAGKMYLYEDDTRTFLTKETGFPGWESGSTTLEGTQQLLLRNTSQSALRNFATWWMDLGSSGWFNAPELWTKMEQLKPLDLYFLDHPTPFEPEIAAIIDERSMLNASNSWTSRSTVYEARQSLGRAGAPFGQYLLSDLTNGRIPANGKLYVVLATNSLSAMQREQMRNALKGKTVLWLYEPGRINLDPDCGTIGAAVKNKEPQTDSEELRFIQDLTGFRVVPAGKRQPLSITAVGKQAGLSTLWDESRTIDFISRFAVRTEPNDEIWAVYPNGAAAIVYRQNASDGSQSIYCGVPQLDSALIRAAARRAGVHLYADNECNVCANGPYITLHASRSGAVNVDTGRTGTVVDYLTGECLGSGPKLRLTVAEGETRILEIK